jgi:hypothetical protein
MAFRRADSVSIRGVGLVAVLFFAAAAMAADRESKLAGEAAAAERILVAIPEQKGVAAGKTIDIAPGEKFIVEIQRALRGTGKKSSPALIIQGGDGQKHPRFVAGKPYLFLLKKDAQNKRWVSLGSSEIPVKDGKAQFLEDGKIVDEVSLDALEELFVKEASASAGNDPTRESLTGNWIVVISDLNKGLDLYTWMIEFTPDGTQGTSARLAAASKQMQASTLRSSAIAGDDVHLVFDADGATFDFRARFENGLARGNVVPARSLVLAARLLPTDLTSMKRYDDPVVDPAREEYLDAAGQEDAFGPLSRFVRRYPKSPLALPAFALLMGQAREAGLERPKFEAIAAECLESARLWGPRMELRAYVDMGLYLSAHEYLPELGLEYRNRAQPLLDDESPVSWKAAVGIERGKRLIAADHVAEGIAVLQKFREDEPFNPEITYALARQAEKEKRTDDALALYGEIVVLPLLENSLLESLKKVAQKMSREQSPSRVVVRLWTEKHGDRRGMTEWLDELYTSRMRSIAAGPRPPRRPEEGTKVALFELFTNGGCLPCVAADVSLLALQTTYEKSEVIVLQYHQNKPGPDPLANEESLERFKQYQGDGTPTLALNGRRVVGAGGFLPEAPLLYRRLLSFVEPLLEEKTDLRIDLKAHSRNEKVVLSAAAQGLKNFPANARLMLVLAEERVDLPMSNGIRSHEMVVRHFPGGMAGIAPLKGQLSYTGDVDLVKLRKQLARQMAAAERENELEFNEKPLDLKSLQFVALLQNIETGEVLQAAAIPVIEAAEGVPETRPAAKPSPASKPAPGGN